MVIISQFEVAPKLPTTTAGQLKALKEQFRNLKNPEQGRMKTTTSFSAIEANLRKHNEKAGADKEINPSTFTTDRKTIESLEKILPPSAGKLSLLKGLQLEVKRKKAIEAGQADPLNSVQKNLAEESRDQLRIIVKQLMHRNAFRKETENKTTELLKGGIMRNFSDGVKRLKKKISKMNPAQLAAAGAVAYIGITSLYNLLFSKDKDGNESLLTVAGRWTAAIATIHFGTKWMSSDGESIFSGAKKLISKTAADTVGSGSVPDTEKLKEMGMKGEYGEEIMALTNCSMPTVLRLWHAARGSGKIKHRDLGLPGKWKNKMSENQIFELVDYLFQEYPRKIREYLTPEERRTLDDTGGWKLVENWYIENKFVRNNNLEMKFGDFYADYIMDNPPPGRKLDV